MIRELVKIANKLDRLGLTSEADLLDSEIRKMAWGDLQKTKSPISGEDITPPPPAIAQAMDKYLNTTTIGGRFYNEDMSIEKLINTQGPYAAQNTDLQIRSFCQYIKKELARDGGGNFYRWYVHTIEEAGNYTGHDPDAVVSEDLMELKSMIEDSIKDPGIKPEIKETYKKTIAELIDTARAFLGRGSESSQAPVTPKMAPAKTEAPVAETAMNVSPSPVAADPTKSNLTGWDRYMAKTQYGPSVKRAWDKYTSSKAAKGLWNPSFGSFAKWYGDNMKVLWDGKNKSPEQVVKILNELATSDILN